MKQYKCVNLFKQVNSYDGGKPVYISDGSYGLFSAVVSCCWRWQVPGNFSHYLLDVFIFMHEKGEKQTRHHVRGVAASGTVIIKDNLSKMQTNAMIKSKLLSYKMSYSNCRLFLQYPITNARTTR